MIHFRCTTLVHIFDYIWMLFDLQTFEKKKGYKHISICKKKVTDGSKLKTEQKYSAELETMLSLQHFG